MKYKNESVKCVSRVNIDRKMSLHIKIYCCFEHYMNKSFTMQYINLFKLYVCVLGALARASLRVYVCV